MKWSSRTRTRDTSQDNRTNIVGAVIFLFAFAIVARLLTVQVFNYDVYAARALQQHGVAQEIVPQRGRIFVRTNSPAQNLYPLAANKEFALVYSVPKDIHNPRQAAQALTPVLYPLTHEEPDQAKMLAVIEQDIRKQLFQAALVAQAPGVGVEVVINEAEVGVALEKERLLLAERLQTQKEEKTKAYQQELEEIFSKESDPYEPLVKKVDKDALDQIMALEIEGIAYSLSSYRYYPEKTIGSNVLGYVVENPHNQITQGSYGVEGYFNNELSGVMGALKAERDARGELIIVADREVQPAIDGSDIILTLDKTIQDVACRALNAASLRHGADLGSLIIINPKTGAVIAMCSYPDFDPNDYGKTKNLEQFNNAVIFNAYEPGSTFKSITMAAGIDVGAVSPQSTFIDTGSVTIAGETIKNADNKVYGERTMTEVLENSINTGVIHVARAIGVNNFAKYLQDFGFGKQTGIELKTEVEGNVSSLYDKMHGANLNLAVASFGQSITATPLQMVMAYSALANQGILMKPYIVEEIIAPDGSRTKTQPVKIRQVVSPRTASLVSGMLVSVVERGHSKRAKVPGYYVAAKTGTAQIASRTSRGYGNQTNHTLIGFAPADYPQFVMLTHMENPKDARYAESTAAPLFGEVAAFVLNYYQVEKERKQ